MELPTLFRWIVTTLERLGVDYAIGGSLASMRYGEARFTNDIDIVFDPTAVQLEDLLRQARTADYYVSDEAARSALHSRGAFNLIDPDFGVKADFYFVGITELDRDQLRNSRMLQLDDDISAKFAGPEETILKKLQFYAEGGSHKHIRDIGNMLRLGRVPIDRVRIGAAAATLGLSDSWAEVVRLVDEAP